MKRLVFLSILIICSVQIATAQKDTVYVRGKIETGMDGTLNAAVDSVKEHGTLSSVVFRLTPNDYYVLTDSIVTTQEDTLEIVAPEPGNIQAVAPPQILWTSNEEVDRTYMMKIYGDLIMKNIWLLYADTEKNQLQTGITFEDDLSVGDTERGTFENVIFSYAQIGAESGGAITVKADNFQGVFKDCYFRNLTDPHFQYYGRAISFPYTPNENPGFHYDSLLFENTTFANLSRIVTQWFNQFGDNIHLNHCTVLNTVGRPIQTYGWVNDLSITNSIFVNPYMYGYRAADVCDENQSWEDFQNGLCDPPESALFQVSPVDSFGFDQYVDFTDQDRQILLSHTSYAYKDYLKAFYTECDDCQDRIEHGEQDLLHNPYPYLGQRTIDFMDSNDAEGNKVFPTMNVDSTTLHLYTEPGFVTPATNRDSMLTFIGYKWYCCSDLNWAYKPWASHNRTWPLPENMAYTNDTLLTAAMGGFPLGDLNWFPEQKAAWETQREAEWANINSWLQTGSPKTTDVEQATSTLPSGYKLEQNYPNPFNPSTTITFELPVSTQVHLVVFDMLGRTVATLADGKRSAGSHQLRFNASHLSSGVYFYQLQAADYVQTRQMVLIK